MTRKDLVNLLKTLLVQVRVSNGYATDVGQTVEYGEGINEDPDQDCIAIYVGQRNHGEDSTNGMYVDVKYTYSVVLDMVVFSENDVLEKADDAVEDILKFLDENDGLQTPGMLVQVVKDETALSSHRNDKAHAAIELNIVF
jgi:hypothetical protein